jgi:transcriptional regulator with XRE-family HTH domain
MPRATSKSPEEAVRPEIRAVLAVNILNWRSAKGWSQEALAFEAGLHRTFIAHVERHARNISLDNLEKIARALGIDTYQLLLPPSAQ